MEQLIREWVMSCEQCIRESQINQCPNRLHLQSPIVHVTAPEEALQINLVPELPPSSGFENIAKAMDVISRYLFAYPTSNKTPKQLLKSSSNL